jgi:hypothetical protein
MKGHADGCDMRGTTVFCAPNCPQYQAGDRLQAIEARVNALDQMSTTRGQEWDDLKWLLDEVRRRTP